MPPHRWKTIALTTKLADIRRLRDLLSTIDTELDQQVVGLDELTPVVIDKDPGDPVGSVGFGQQTHRHVHLGITWRALRSSWEEPTDGALA